MRRIHVLSILALAAALVCTSFIYVVGISGVFYEEELSLSTVVSWVGRGLFINSGLWLAPIALYSRSTIALVARVAVLMLQAPLWWIFPPIMLHQIRGLASGNLPDAFGFLASGLALGVSVIVIVAIVLAIAESPRLAPSNKTVDTDARKSGARGSP